MVWYALFIAAFRCPSSLDGLTDHSSLICKPCLTATSYVSPYLEPYYATYAAPYVDAAHPYLKKLDQQVYSPILNLGKLNYAIYGAPRVSRLQKYGTTSWNENVKPQIDAAKIQTQRIYGTVLSPYLSKTSSAAAPYITTGRDSVLHVYDHHILPAYTASRPYILKTYYLGHGAIIETALPHVRSVWASSTVFIDRIIWPKLRILYGENVEPQLMKIGERLGRYRDGKKLKAAIEEIEK